MSGLRSGIWSGLPPCTPPHRCRSSRCLSPLCKRKTYARALATAERLKKAEPSEPTGEILTAAVYLNQGKLQAGREALLRALEIRPGDIASNEMLAKLALAAGRPDEARRYLQNILDAHPERSETYIALAELEAKTGRAAMAEAVLLKGVQTAPSDAEIAVALARLQLSTGEAQKALASATGALDKFPRNPDIARDCRQCAARARVAQRCVIELQGPDRRGSGSRLRAYRLGQGLFGAIHARKSAMGGGQ